ncbi:MAG: site-specific integrase [Acidobacteria bacterium]|nr:site-specific integrase [Acidobacteriota bacterium]MCA1650796.1 site-specific integrase [Acidobacteriota bacterium]
MSLRKRCSRTADSTLPNGKRNPLRCDGSPRCEHYWFYDFRVNGRRYRDTTETADKQKAKDIEARERARILEGRHGIRRQPDITFRQFADIYLKDHADLHKRSADRDREILKTLNRAFGSVILHELTPHRIQQFMRDRLAGRWRAHGQKRASKPLRPGTVNRELDTLKSILSKAVEWGKLLDSPARGVKRLKVDNRRTRILTPDEQRRLLEAAPRKLRAVIVLALITGARVGELLGLRWEHVAEGSLTFLETKNGRPRRIPLSGAAIAVLDALPRVPGRPYVFTNATTEDRYTVNGCAHVFRRALDRASIRTGDVTLHTLRHTALSRMIAENIDDYTVMAVSGHSSTRMLARYTHPTEERKLDALDTFSVGTRWAHGDNAPDDALTELKELLAKSGGRQEARTPDLRVANGKRRKR